MKAKVLGILGGIGPLASVYFADLLVNMTQAEKDQEHIPFYLYNDVFIPDRTDYILGKNSVNPLPELINGIKKLESVGCDYIAVTCNTAHYFYDEMRENSQATVLNIIEEAVDYACKRIGNIKKIGVLATDGTIQSGIYEKVITRRSVEFAAPCPESQKEIMNIIYNQVKAGKQVDIDSFTGIINEMRNEGCDAIILGCTELSVINKAYALSIENADIVDAMEALVIKCITVFDKKVKE